MSTTDLACTTALITGATAASAKPPLSRWPIGAPTSLVGGRDAARRDPVVAPIQAKGGKADFVAADLRSPDSARSQGHRTRRPPRGHPGQQRRHLPPWVRPRKLAKEDIDAFAVNVKVLFVLVAELTPGHSCSRQGRHHQRRYRDRRSLRFPAVMALASVI